MPNLPIPGATVRELGRPTEASAMFSKSPDEAASADLLKGISEYASSRKVILSMLGCSV